MYKSIHNMWQAEHGSMITLLLQTHYKKAVLCSEFTADCEPVLVKHNDIADIAYVSTMVVARVPAETKFLFLQHRRDDQYVIAGSATHSGHVAVGVNGPLGPAEYDMFSDACKRVVQYEKEQRMLADKIVACARKRAREMLEDAETAIDETRPYRLGAVAHVRELHKSFQ